MDNKDISIVFFGNERLATGVTTEAPTLRRLIAAGYNVVAVVSHNTDTRSRRERELEIAQIAAEHKIPLLLPAKPALVIDQLQALHPTIGILVAYGKIVPQSVIDIFPRGIINIHPSQLPRHRGPIPIESVILEGAHETSVSIMRLVHAMDAGPVYGRVSVTLQGDETKQELANQLLNAGGEHLVQILPAIVDGSLVPTPQDEATATYDTLIQKSDGLLDFTKSAVQLEREIRAYQGWPKSRTTLVSTDVVVTAAHVEIVNTDNQTQPGSPYHAEKVFGLHTADGVLVIDRLKPAGKQEMSAAAFVNGYGKDL